MLELLKMKRITLVSLLPLFLAIFAGAQEPETAEPDTTILTGEIDEVTVTAFRSPYNLLNVPAPVNLILPLQLEAGDALTPVEALNQVPGVLMHHGTLNTNRLTIRGIGSRTPYATNKIKAYFGEIPLTSGDGETTLEDLENSAIKRVEIIKGPSSSLYGAGLAGVILFHPKMVTRNFAMNRISASSFAALKNTFSAGIAREKLNIFALGSYLKSNGYRENNATHRANAMVNAMVPFSKNSNLQLLMKATSMKGYIPSSLNREMFENSPEKAAPNWAAVQGYEAYTNGQYGLSYNFIPGNTGKITVSTFGSFRDADELRPFNRLRENSAYMGFRGYAQKIIRGKETQITLSSGMEFFRERYNWTTHSNEHDGLLSDNRERRQYENLFFQVESAIHNRIFISAGINGNLTRFYYTDYFTENGDQSGSHNYKPVFSPRAGMNYLITKSISVFANVSHGFSTPTFEETLLPDGEVNPEIKPETGWNYEAGVRSLVNNRLQLSASYYRIHISNLLVARRTGEDAYIGVNAGKSVHPGLESELRWNVTNLHARQQLVLLGNLTFARYHFVDFVDDNHDFSGKILPGTARKTGLLMALYSPIKNISFTGWYRFTGKMFANDANTDFTEPYGITSLDLKYSVKIRQFRLEMKGGIQNLFDVHYASMLAVNAPSPGGNAPRYFYPGNPRNYFFTLLLGFE